MTQKKENILAKELFEQLSETFYIQGKIQLEDFSDKEKLRKKIIKLLPKDDNHIIFKISHQSIILKNAKQYAEKEEYEFAYTLYAIYFEHFINEIIDIWSERNSIDFKTSSSLIRRLGLEDKYTWLLKILHLPNFMEKHAKNISLIAEKRNSFIHYKYPGVSGDKDDDAEKEWKMNISKLTKAISYTKMYRKRVIYREGNRH